MIFLPWHLPLWWRHNGHDSISNHQPYDCLLNSLFRSRWKKTSKLRVTGICAMASNAENVSIWWHHHDRGCRLIAVFTRGQFWPSGIVVACVCLCVCPCVCVNPQLVRAITHHPFKLGSPNLDHRCKRPWLRSLLFWGVIDLDLQGQI